MTFYNSCYMFYTAKCWFSYFWSLDRMLRTIKTWRCLTWPLVFIAWNQGDHEFQVLILCCQKEKFLSRRHLTAGNLVTCSCLHSVSIDTVGNVLQCRKEWKTSQTPPKYQGRERVTDCLHHCIKLRIHQHRCLPSLWWTLCQSSWGTRQQETRPDSGTRLSHPSQLFCLPPLFHLADFFQTAIKTITLLPVVH